MRVIERSIYRGPHLYGMHPMIRIRLDLGALEQWPTDRLDGFAAALVVLLPGLSEHHCNLGQPGGFVQRLEQGTWLGHVIEHVAIELLTQSGAAVTRGKTRAVKRQPGVYDILYSYADEVSGLAAGRAAMELVHRLLPPALQGLHGLDRVARPEPPLPTDLPALIAALRKLVATHGLGPSTAALVEEARRRKIPVTRLNEASLIQLGTGSRQQRIRASVTGKTGLIGAELAANKHAAKRLLGDIGLPVPRGEVVRDRPSAIAAARRLGWPVVVKPLDGNHGRGVSTHVGDNAMLLAAFDAARSINRSVIIEQMLTGTDHRFLVVGGKLVAVAERVPAHVVGNGRDSIRKLIDTVNADPRRGDGHQAALTRIGLDDALHACLALQNRSIDNIPLPGEHVALAGTANLSTGGTAIDRTDEVHPDNAAIAEQAALAIGLDVAGIDIVSPDIGRSLYEAGGGIVEVNAAPGLRMHLAPSEGSPRDVARPIIASLFPRRRSSRIPVFAVTGTNGKTTTVRMLARILREAGYRVGFTSTSGVYINDCRQVSGDASGPKSARRVLRNPVVDAAVFETARGGLLREGLAFDLCDVGAVLNVSEDHLGSRGVHSLRDLARVKSVVVRAVARRGAAVLNADDPRTVAMARHCRGRVVWFSNDAAALHRAPIDAHVADGGMAILNIDQTIVRIHAGERQKVADIRDIPATLGGIAEFNILNALAAAAMAAAHGIDIPAIAAGLRSFQASFEDSPGRLNIVEAHGVTVIIDYAHNTAALNALARVLDRYRGKGRLIGMVGLPGDRRDSDLRDVGAQAAGMFDEILFREGADGRGRERGTINALMVEGALAAGKDPATVRCFVNEADATDFGLRHVRPGDVLVLTPTDVDAIFARVQAFAEARDPERSAVHEGTSHDG
ncbi:MAG: cyanophycin synthetase [Blastomonas sp. CACIA14H2]|uniref:cyanophycin synthetase n=1 Tax=Blastomonas sp. CACIA14H2 TaxID=1419876 RepID=UPI0003D00991|nr:MAG: cyanophycin synthetase [Blastomonas sp. CACIA14H2]